MVLLTPPRAVVHVDLDGARHIFRVHGWDYPAGDDRLFETGLRGALDFFDEHRIAATFFAIAEDLDDPAKRSLLQEIVHRGHEVASHSITHRHLTRLPEAERRREVRESKARLEDALGVPIAGFRAPAFDCDRVVIDEVGAAGYRYDSSLVGGRPGPFTALVGAAPFELTRAGAVELPLPVRRGLPAPFHPSFSLVLGSWYFRLGLVRAARTVPVFVMLFHLTDFAEPLEASRLGPRGSRFFTLSYLTAQTKRARCAAMVADLKRAYQIVPTMSVFDPAGGPTLAGMNS
jgi:peptidoglycan/xylan/chitin deacetylase (PgdA/CDA1 family)